MNLLAAAAETVSVPFHSHASVVVVMVGVATFFWWAFTRLGPSLGETVTRRQKNWVVAGVVWTFVFSYWPLHDIAERYLFIAHMLQHTVFTLVAPACFLLGSPNWLWSWALRRRGARAAIQFFSKPLIALLVFNSLIAITHWPSIVERSLHNELFHFSVHLALFVSATFMWVPVINRIPELPRLGAPAKMAFLFAQSIVPTVPASFLTFSVKPLYKTYELAPRMIHGLGAVEDQQYAAAIMKVGAGTFLWGIVGYLFACWWRDTKAGTATDNRRKVEPLVGSLAGLTVSGGRVPNASTPHSSTPVGATVTATPNGPEAGASALAVDVLTWEAVKKEFDEIDAGGAATGESQ